MSKTLHRSQIRRMVFSVIEAYEQKNPRRPIWEPTRCERMVWEKLEKFLKHFPLFYEQYNVLPRSLKRQYFIPNSYAESKTKE